MFSTLRQKKILGCAPGRSTATGTIRPSLTRGQMMGIGMGSDEKVGRWIGEGDNAAASQAALVSAVRRGRQSFTTIGGPMHVRPVTELRRCRSGLRLTGRGHLEGSQHLTFNDLTVDNCNILNTAQLLQLVTAYSVFFFCSYIDMGPMTYGPTSAEYWGPGPRVPLVLTLMTCERGEGI